MLVAFPPVCVKAAYVCACFAHTLEKDGIQIEQSIKQLIKNSKTNS